MEYIGIADCHGLESFIPAKKFNAEEESFTMNNSAVAFMKMRADANRQRHAVVYKAKVSGDDSDEIERLMADGQYAEALIFLKDNAREVGLIKSGMGNAEKSWNMIPNPDLDPYN